MDPKMVDNNLDAISLVAHSLFNLDFERSPLEIINAKLKGVEKQFIWLQEVPEEIKKILGDKSDVKLNTLPKTPSIKRRDNLRARLKTLQENGESPVEEIEQTKRHFVKGEIEDSPKRRPLRSTRQRTASAVPSKSCKEKSKKPAVAFSNTPPPQEIIVSEKVPPPHSDVGMLSKSKPAGCYIPADDVNDNKSPSVRDRAKAYETMLNHKSPVKSHTNLTPNSTGRNFASATISSLAKSSPQPVTRGKRSSSSKPNPSPSKFSRKSPLRRPKRSSRNSKNEYQTPPTKPTRTKKRLALKKKSAETSPEKNIDKDKLSIGVSTERKSISSRDSAVSTASSLMSDECKASPVLEMEDGNLDETHVVITEEYNLMEDGQQELVNYDEIQTKNVFIPMEDYRDDSRKSDKNTTFTKDSPGEMSPTRSTRTRMRAMQDNSCSKMEDVKDTVGVSPSSSHTNSKPSVSVEDIGPKPGRESSRSTRTRTRVQDNEDVEKQEGQAGGIRTRTRKRLADASKIDSEIIRDVKVVASALPASTTLLAEEQGQRRTTRSRMKKDGAESIPCGVNEEVLAGSPAIKCSKKRPVQEYGSSPHPKRSRSCAGLAEGNSTFNIQSILLTSSPTKGNFGERGSEEHDDTVSQLMSPVGQNAKPYMFMSAQRSSFMKRTPNFTKTNSKLYSFFGNSTPTQSNGALTSFLKRNTPSKSVQSLQEQRMQRFQEKEKLDKERLSRAAKLKKQKIEEQKRLRDDRLRRVAEAREKRLREEREMKDKINKKFENKVSLKDKMLEEKLRAENEKKEMREKKMMDANSRRRQEEEERLRKLAEQEEEAKRQQEWMQRKKEFEDEERKRQIEEDKRKQEERLQKLQEEKARQKKVEEEKKERLRKERERQLALERAEKERAEREKKEERERKKEEQRIQEELKRAEEQKKFEERRAEEEEKIKAMKLAQQRAHEEAMRLQKEREAKKIELQKLINQCKSNTALNASTGLNSSASSFVITLDGKKVYKSIIDPNNYDIEDKGSDESTDDESAPKKKIPEWAMSVPLNTALIRQYQYPPDLNKLFRPHLVEPPDLSKLFPTSRQRHKFKYRTSSAVWTSPLMKK